MSLQIQYSRISHHALTTPGATFSVPPGEDFTVINGTTSWNVDGSELANREIGIVLPDNRVYMRSDSTILELINSTQVGSGLTFSGGSFSVIPSSGGTGSWSETLAVGNDSEIYSVIMGTSTVIRSSNGGGQIDLDYSGVADNVLITTDNGGYGESYIDMTPTYIDISANGYTSDIYLDQESITILADNNTIVSGGAVTTGIAGTTQIETGTYSAYINSRQFRYASATNASAATTTLASIPMSNDQTLTVHVLLNAYCASPNRNLGCSLTAVFLKYGGSIYQTSTTDQIIKDGFGDGTTATIDTDGTNVRIRVTNGSGLTTNWKASYDFLLTT